MLDVLSNTSKNFHWKKVEQKMLKIQASAKNSDEKTKLSITVLLLESIVI